MTFGRVVTHRGVMSKTTKQTLVDTLDRGLSEIAAAKILGVSVRTLQRMSRRGEGPRRIRISPRRTIYRERECLDYVESRAAHLP
jgi:predicted DNA-binding transcriptional regulator AlpA